MACGLSAMVAFWALFAFVDFFFTPTHATQGQICEVGQIYNSNLISLHFYK